MIKKFIVINCANGEELELKGTSLEQVTDLFAELAFKDGTWNKDIPSGFKKGEGYFLTGLDKESGFFTPHMILTKLQYAKRKDYVNQLKKIAQSE